ncbi:hypothetical protein HY493_04775 [Candidatus Woesearchaeota archaeon]|nr:hypothetical protein [Candidatus Woesearchaeota archaeon]
MVELEIMNNSAVSPGDILLLRDLQNRVNSEFRENQLVDIRPIAIELGLDLDKIMHRVIDICKTRTYTAGGHVFCTKYNVLPEYERVGSLVLDGDHVEGLRQILRVDMGQRPDY